VKERSPRPNLSEMHQADDPEDVERRRDDAVERMRVARAELVRAMADMDPDAAFELEEWAPMHILWHLASSHTHMDPARQIVEEGLTELPERDSRSEYEAAYARVLANIDDWIRWSSAFTRDQLVTHARKGNREYYVVGMVESTAEHVTDHVEQLKETRARLPAPAARG
jgi:hypothetical protein